MLQNKIILSHLILSQARHHNGKGGFIRRAGAGEIDSSVCDGCLLGEDSVLRRKQRMVRQGN